MGSFGHQGAYRRFCESLTGVYGCKMFHQYIYGKEIVPFTDHKSLEAIFKKPITSTPKKLQRILLALQPSRLTKLYEPGWDENKNLSNLLRKPEENLVIFVFQGPRHRVDFYKMVSDRLYNFTHLRILYLNFFILKHLKDSNITDLDSYNIHKIVCTFL